MSGFLLIGLIVVVWLVVLAPLLLRGQKPIRKAGEAFDETRVILEGGTSVPMRRRPRLAGEEDEDTTDSDHNDDGYEIVDSPSIFRHRREDVEDDDQDEEQTGAPDSTETEPAVDSISADEDSANIVIAGATRVDHPGAEHHDTMELESIADDDLDTPVVEVIEEWRAEDHYPMDSSYSAPIDLMHHDERVRAVVEYRASHAGESEAPADAREDSSDYGELTQADMEFAERRRGRGYYDPKADREFARNQYIRRQRTLLGLGVAVVLTLILGFVLGGGAWALPAVAVGVTALYLMALRSQVRAENELRARRIRRLRRSRLGVRDSEDLPQRLRRPGAVVLELDDESPDFEGLATTYLPVDEHEDDYRSHRTRRVS